MNVQYTNASVVIAKKEIEICHLNAGCFLSFFEVCSFDCCRHSLSSNYHSKGNVLKWQLTSRLY